MTVATQLGIWNRLRIVGPEDGQADSVSARRTPYGPLQTLDDRVTTVTVTRSSLIGVVENDFYIVSSV
jgi:hypothetical protein